MFLTFHYPFHTKRLLIGHKFKTLLAALAKLRKFITLRKCQALKYGVYSKKYLKTGVFYDFFARCGFVAAALHKNLMHESPEIPTAKKQEHCAAEGLAAIKLSGYTRL